VAECYSGWDVGCFCPVHVLTEIYRSWKKGHTAARTTYFHFTPFFSEKLPIEGLELTVWFNHFTDNSTAGEYEVLPNFSNFIQLFNTWTKNSKIYTSKTRILLEISLWLCGSMKVPSVFQAVYSSASCQVWDKIFWVVWMQHRIWMFFHTLYRKRHGINQPVCQFWHKTVTTVIKLVKPLLGHSVTYCGWTVFTFLQI
jgi:hypothetical protein